MVQTFSTIGQFRTPPAGIMHQFVGFLDIPVPVTSSEFAQTGSLPVQEEKEAACSGNINSTILPVPRPITNASSKLDQLSESKSTLEGDKTNDLSVLKDQSSGFPGDRAHLDQSSLSLPTSPLESERVVLQNTCTSTPAATEPVVANVPGCLEPAYSALPASSAGTDSTELKEDSSCQGGDLHMDVEMTSMFQGEGLEQPINGAMHVGGEVSEHTAICMTKTMMVEVEIAVLPDDSHGFLPGERTLVRFQLTG
jgi:hypothetical protein